MTSLSEQNTIHISQSSAFTYNDQYVQKFFKENPYETGNSQQQENHEDDSKSKGSKSNHNEIVKEALGFVIGSSKIRGKSGKLMCSRYTFKSSHAESFKKAMKFLKENGYVKSRDRNCAKVCKPYRTLKGLEFALKRDYFIKETIVPPFNCDHYLIAKSSEKVDFPEMIKNKKHKPHDWDEKDSSQNNNLSLLELCNIVYEYEKECKIKETQHVNDSVSTEKNSPQNNSNSHVKEKNTSPFHVDYILNHQDENNNSKIPPLKSLSSQDKAWWVVNQQAPVLVYSNANIFPFGFNPDWKKCDENQDEITQSSESSDIQLDSEDVNSNKRTRSYTKKSRRTVSSEEKDVLEKFYIENAYPSRQRYDEIRRRLGWNSSRRVTKWFNNRRYNEKNK